MPAAKTLYLKEATAAGSNHLSLQDGGSAPSAATTTTGQIMGTVAATKYARMDSLTERASSVLGTTAEPSSGPDNTLGDCFRSELTMRGDFAAANWTFSIPVQGETRTTSTTGGKLRIRVWRATSATGASAVEITSSTQVTSAYANLANSAAQTLTLTWAAPAVTLTDEYLFVQVAHQLDTAGNNVNADVHFRVGSSSTVITSSFTPTLVGTASGSTATGGTVTGKAARSGSDSGSTTTGGSVTGKAARLGSFTGSTVTGGSVTGKAGKLGTASGSSATSGTVTGRAARLGTASGSSVTAGSVIGSEGDLGSVSGTSTSSGSVAGAVGYLGSTSGASTTGGSVIGAAGWIGTVSGSTVTDGSSAGVAARYGSVAGSVVSDGSAVGVPGSGGQSAEGSVSGTTQSSGYVVGTRPRLFPRSAWVQLDLDRSGSVHGTTRSHGRVRGKVGPARIAAEDRRRAMEDELILAGLL